MAEGKWDVQNKDDKIIYVMGDINIEDCSGGPRPFWVATQQGQVIHRGEDLLAVMDYCEKFMERLS